MRCLPGVIAACALCVSSARAGPPLVSDDPHTIGAGNLEVILSASAAGFADFTDLVAPKLDLTLGLVDGLDVGLAATPIFTLASGEPTEAVGAADLVLKWQPLRGERWHAAFTPTVGINATLLRETSFVLPIQIEYTGHRLSLGADGGYIVVLNDPDVWFASVYAGLAASDSLLLLAECWGGLSSGDGRHIVGFSLGFDWLMTESLHLLASGAPAFAASGGERLRWRAFLGFQWDRALW